MLLRLLLLVGGASAKVTGVWIDVEGIYGTFCPHMTGGCAPRTTTFIDTLRNATAVAHGQSLRFAVDANVAWATATGTDEAQRPLSQQVMDIVDEITLMDYFDSCGSSTSDPAMPCDPTDAMINLAPFLSYATWLHNGPRNRTVFVDLGVNIGFPGIPGANNTQWGNSAIKTELQLELFLQRVAKLSNYGTGGNQLFHNVAVFEHMNWLGVASYYPCPGDEQVCALCKSDSQRNHCYGRPTRSLWMYDLVGTDNHPASTQPLCTAFRDGSHCDVLNDEAARARFFSWARQRNVNELYVRSGGLHRMHSSSVPRELCRWTGLYHSHVRLAA